VRGRPELDFSELDVDSLTQPSDSAETPAAGTDETGSAGDADDAGESGSEGEGPGDSEGPKES
jgi:hypothetical protein